MWPPRLPVRLSKRDGAWKVASARRLWRRRLRQGPAGALRPRPPPQAPSRHAEGHATVSPVWMKPAVLEAPGSAITSRKVRQAAGSLTTSAATQMTWTPSGPPRMARSAIALRATGASSSTTTSTAGSGDGASRLLATSDSRSATSPVEFGEKCGAARVGRSQRTDPGLGFLACAVGKPLDPLPCLVRTGWRPCRR
jgi:hypothetical protein